MAQPNKAELKKKQDFKQSLVKTIGGVDALEAFNSSTENMIELMSTIRLTDKKMCSILRSSVRKTWMMSPVRLLKLELARQPDMNPSTRTKWLCECEHCHGMFKMTDVEVDHIKGEHSLKTLSDVEHFARSILDVSITDLQVMCKPCHAIKGYAERFHMSFEDAAIEKAAIEWCKKNKTPAQTKFLLAKGFGEKEISNATKRRNAYIQFLNRK